jgi:biopolymer transport protein ExbB/biopolymer transport protein TolQ
MLVDSLVRVALLGSSWVLYLLLSLSVVSFGAMLERFVFFRRNGRSADALAERLRKAVLGDDEADVDRALAGEASVEGTVLRDALAFRDGGPDAVTDAVEASLGRERARLERSMTLLGTLGNNAPFIGLFGTVLGVIEAFSHLGARDEAAMTQVMTGIAEALVATGVGIFVAIPAVVAYNVAQKKIADVENDVASLAKLLTAWLKTRERNARVRATVAEPSASESAAPRSASSKKAKKAEPERAAEPRTVERGAVGPRAVELAPEGAE